MPSRDPSAQGWLEAWLARERAVAGTVHRVEGGLLRLAAAVNIPPPVERATETIPIGKGMAGLAWQRDRAVSTCDLADPGASADVRPGARAVGAGAAVALPVHDAGGSVRAVVGIAFAEARELGEDLLAALARTAATLP